MHGEHAPKYYLERRICSTKLFDANLIIKIMKYSKKGCYVAVFKYSIFIKPDTNTYKEKSKMTVGISPRESCFLRQSNNACFG